MKFTEMLQKLEQLDLTKPEKKKMSMKVDWLEDEFLPKLATTPYSPGQPWWLSTNDPSTWGPLSKSAAVAAHKHKKKLEQQVFWGGYHKPAHSLSAYNYTQVWSGVLSDKPKMTREQAIALNNGDV